MFLQRASAGVGVDVSNPHSNGTWAIQPAEEFILLDVTYSLEEGDGLTILPSYIEEVEINNQSPLQQSMTVGFNQKVAETSSFSRTQGFSITTGTSVKIGVPLLTSGVEVTLNTSQTTSQDWTYGGSETQEDGRTYSFPVLVPPYSRGNARISIARYNATATYTGRFKGKTSGKIITLSGKWNGVKAGKITYDIVVDGARVRSFDEIPQEPVVLPASK